MLHIRGRKIDRAAHAHAARKPACFQPPGINQPDEKRRIGAAGVGQRDKVNGLLPIPIATIMAKRSFDLAISTRILKRIVSRLFLLRLTCQFQTLSILVKLWGDFTLSQKRLMAER